jgi:hypothetical protein
MSRIRPATMAIALTLALTGVASAAEEPARHPPQPDRPRSQRPQARHPGRSLEHAAGLDADATPLARLSPKERPRCSATTRPRASMSTRSTSAAFRKRRHGYRLKVGAPGAARSPSARQPYAQADPTRRWASSTSSAPASRSRPASSSARTWPVPPATRRTRRPASTSRRARPDLWAGCDYTLDASARLVRRRRPRQVRGQWRHLRLDAGQRL